MLRFLLCFSVLTTLSASSARAAGLVQLVLGGRVTTSGGAHVELFAGALGDTRGAPREVRLSIFVAEGTQGADLVELLEHALRSKDIDAFARTHQAPGGQVPSAVLFVRDAMYVQTRLGHGLTQKVTVCEESPRSVRLIAADARPGAGTLRFGASTFNLHTEKSSSAELEVELTEGQHGSGVAEHLFQVAYAAGWVGDRISADEWAPTRMRGGERIRGLVIELDSTADWGLRVELNERD